MPRISTALIRQAYAHDPLLPLLLRPCRELQSAQSELRWLREHGLTLSRARNGACRPQPLKNTLKRLCLERSGGTPLQYVIGNQPFGDLEILCRSGVLIPRSETESITYHLAKKIIESSPRSRELRILDLCTGTGCISLLLHALLAPHFSRLEILGLDISPSAISLARQNIVHNVANGALSPRAKQDVHFALADIFEYDYQATMNQTWDILVSNPPYISPQALRTVTARSVRVYEPKTALVPPQSAGLDDATGDSFYPRLLDIAKSIRARAVLYEVADVEQAKRVASLAIEQCRWQEISMWRDWPQQCSGSDERNVIGGKTVKILGTGQGRAVFLGSKV